ncbi:hypothetical protein K503DRAFT_179048 [Rhizopogon vinicolor AM-OR11-026]|uniref:Uncharacterized protein n=1 Tax=Rhizopogon vinicolor AM-OR11-026 TaxID=1314800 RepID=A0A1B7N028_9AGAM|nr:hypothetical protein K503DRAFT_179048 [Rhizopogon vinicolor AM-OR11-026]
MTDVAIISEFNLRKHVHQPRQMRRHHVRFFELICLAQSVWASELHCPTNTLCEYILSQGRPRYSAMVYLHSLRFCISQTSVLVTQRWRE